MCMQVPWPSGWNSLMECYKIVFGLSHLNFHEFFEFAKVHSTRAFFKIFKN